MATLAARIVEEVEYHSFREMLDEAEARLRTSMNLKDDLPEVFSSLLSKFEAIDHDQELEHFKGIALNVPDALRFIMGRLPDVELRQHLTEALYCLEQILGRCDDGKDFVPPPSTYGELATRLSVIRHS